MLIGPCDVKSEWTQIALTAIHVVQTILLAWIAQRTPRRRGHRKSGRGPRSEQT